MPLKTGLAFAIAPGCYGGIAPRSDLALKTLIDHGAGVIDSDYLGISGILLFNFGTDDFEAKMWDRITQIIEKKDS